MIKITKKEWTILILLWLGVLSFTYLNTKKINQIINHRKKIESLNINKTFFKRHERKLSQLLEREKELYQSIENIDLGVVAFKHELNTLAKRCNIQRIQIEYKKEFSAQGKLRFTLTFKSHLKNMLNFLSLINEELSYAVVDKVTLRMDKSGTIADSQIFLTYRYRIYNPRNMI